MLGAIADDFTGATDLATMLRRSGHSVAVVIEDGDTTGLGDVDAVVIALKTRTARPDAAVASSLAALRALRGLGATRFYVKYCSTFDSTDEGNIGPILDAVTEELGAARCVVVPALPANGRTVYLGHLFVGSDLLEHSSMRQHPLTPMTRSRVADILRPQTDEAVDEVFHAVVRQGADAIRRALDASSCRYTVIDAIDEDDLAVIAAATTDDVVVSGGSGLALGLHGPGRRSDVWSPPQPGRGVVLCGSVSRATLAQLDVAAQSQPVRQIDLEQALADPDRAITELADWVLTQDAGAHPVVCAARNRSDVRSEQGGIDVAPVVERVLAGVARKLVADGRVTAMIVAGGETSGAVVRELDVQSLRIGPELAPGVCWSTADAGGRRIALALKSGNFGDEDLFVAAWKELA
ncbi:3-oxo-tetronate kinase [Microbacterium murale]|uniref:3-oxo-tetronate kinase n=1 Tax=Microbacterium murale TaxID=1081040 RepID=A0ABU0P9Z1_9MICO|nr:3-oxo-tetronate kinase [Microbacterium murale]MDQ0643782.1 uncharacterized protein YgbK (DUF1537 family) [Microbacterium murale]